MESVPVSPVYLEPVPPDRRSDPKVRRQMSGPAIRAFLNVAKAWELDSEERRCLLGWPVGTIDGWVVGWTEGWAEGWPVGCIEG